MLSKSNGLKPNKYSSRYYTAQLVIISDYVYILIYVVFEHVYMFGYLSVHALCIAQKLLGTRTFSITPHG